MYYGLGWNLDKRIPLGKVRLIVKRVLRKYKYPPELQEEAVDLVLRQAQVFGESWGGA